MESKEYINLALRTESIPETIEIDQMILASTLHMAVITGQLIDQVKRRIFYGEKLDQNKITDLANMMTAGYRIFEMAATTADFDMNTVKPQEFADIMDESKLQLSNINIRCLHAALGCFTESAELIQSIEKQYTTGELDLVNFGEEIGDIEWYQAIGFHASGVTEASCRERNIAKLKKRYPDQFSNENAINRDLEGERDILEGKQ